MMVLDVTSVARSSKLIIEHLFSNLFAAGVSPSNDAASISRTVTLTHERTFLLRTREV